MLESIKDRNKDIALILNKFLCSVNILKVLNNFLHFKDFFEISLKTSIPFEIRQISILIRNFFDVEYIFKKKFLRSESQLPNPQFVRIYDEHSFLLVADDPDDVSNNFLNFM